MIKNDITFTGYDARPLKGVLARESAGTKDGFLQTLITEKDGGLHCLLAEIPAV